MCIICVKPAGVDLPTEECLQNMWVNNPDGAGFMYCENNQVIIRKGFMTYRDFITALYRHVDIDTPAVIHYRWATHGLVDGLRCHPFAVHGKNKTYQVTDLGVAHNGILHRFADKNSDKSDTQLFAEKYLSKLTLEDLRDPAEKCKLYAIIGNTNKLAFLDKDRQLTLFGHFIHDEDGCMYSNTSYLDDEYRMFQQLSRRGLIPTKNY